MKYLFFSSCSPKKLCFVTLSIALPSIRPPGAVQCLPVMEFSTRGKVQNTTATPLIQCVKLNSRYIFDAL
ncbi:hypothetical protein HanRHA438_Chr12g0553791 [Helianthus annuus]|nr:hypothetical protein HanRHA438_Chr12g0553791 [Helianthus annuus]